MKRRDMLGWMGTAAATSLLPAARPRATHGYPANEMINVGGIGTGGRFMHLMKAFKRVPGVRLAAVCDVWDQNLDRARGLADAGALATRDYHELLASKDVEAVIIASPDHWHVPMTVDACAAGKDVYVEKPLTHELAEGRAVIDAQNRHQRIVLVGMQQRSMPHIIKAVEIVRSGRLGKIHKAHLTWNRNTPRARRYDPGIDAKTVDWKRFCGAGKEQPFDAYRFRHWRWFWDFGGGVLTDLMVHWLDVVHWLCGLEHPAVAMTLGDHFAAKDVWEAPDTVQTLLSYPQHELQVYFEGTFVNARNAAMVELMGTDATLYIDRGRYEVFPERGRGEHEELVLGEGPKGADFYRNPDGELLHLTHWVESMRSRTKPNAPAEAGVSAASGAHLGNRALREGKIARWAS